MRLFKTIAYYALTTFVVYLLVISSIFMTQAVMQNPKSLLISITILAGMLIVFVVIGILSWMLVALLFAPERAFKFIRKWNDSKLLDDEKA